MVKQVSRKVFVTLPDLTYEELERWAALQGRPTANLATFLIEIGINAAKERGELPPRQSTNSKSKDK